MLAPFPAALPAWCFHQLTTQGGCVEAPRDSPPVKPVCRRQAVATAGDETAAELCSPHLTLSNARASCLKAQPGGIEPTPPCTPTQGPYRASSNIQVPFLPSVLSPQRCHRACTLWLHILWRNAAHSLVFQSNVQFCNRYLKCKKAITVSFL